MQIRNKIGLFSGILFALNAQAQQAPLKLIGKISDDSTSAPIIQADVFSHDRKYHTTSDGKGNFTLLLPSGFVPRIQVQALGYSPYGIQVEPLALNDTLRLYLKKAQVVLEEVTVQGQRNMIEVGVDHTTIDPSRYQGSKLSSAYNLLKQIPGVQISADGTLRLRGDGNVRVLIDGKPTLLSGKDFVEWMRAQPISTIKNVQVYSASSARIDADMTGGAININLLRKKLDGYQGSISVNGGTQFNNGAAANAVIKKGRLSSSANVGFYTHPNGGTIRVVRQGQNESGTPYTLYQNGKNTAQDYSTSGGLNARWDADTTLVLSALLNFNLFKLASNIRSDYTSRSANPLLVEDFSLNQNRDVQTHGASATFSAEKRLSAKNNVAVDLLLGRTSNQIDNDLRRDGLTSAPDTYFDVKREGAMQARWIRQLGSAGSVEFGGKGVIRTGESNYVGMGSPTPTDRVANQVRLTQSSEALYSIHTFNYKKFGVQYGLRGEYFVSSLSSSFAPESSSTYLNLFPSGSLLYSLNDSNSFRISGSRKTTRPGISLLTGFRDARDPKDVSIGNPLLKPEFKVNSELEYDFYGKSLTIIEVLYHYRTKDAILNYTVPAAGNQVITTFGNAGKVLSTGLSSSVSYNMKRMRLSSDIDLSHYTVTNDLIGLRNSGLLLGTSTRVGYKPDKGGWYFEASGDYQSKRIVLNGTQTGWNLVNLTIEKSLAKRYLLSLLARDVFRTSHFVNTYDNYFNYSYDYRPQVQALILTLTYSFGKDFQYQRPSNNINTRDVQERSLGK